MLTSMKNWNVGFIGGGNMAKALANRFLCTGMIEKTNLYVSTAHEESLKYWKDIGVNATLNNEDLAQNCDVIILSIKPQVFNETFKPCAIKKTAIIISIMAGITITHLNEIWPEIPVIRAIPNLPVSVGEGCIGYCYRNPSLLINVIPSVLKLFETCGVCIEIEEKNFPTFSALAGSGPAFICTIIEALADGSVKMGLPRKLSITIALQMMLGTSKMILNSDKHSAVLKDEVCSPGGMSIAGIHALEKGSIRDCLMNAIEAATNRCKELSN